MIEYLKGTIVEINPAYIVLEAGGIGYFLNISLNTYSALGKGEIVTMPVHEVIREDAHLLFAFADREERELFRLLISVNGVGPNTARMMLSSLRPSEVVNAISESNVHAIKSIKGIGVKTAERVIVDLRDKVGKVAGSFDFFDQKGNTIREEALSALMMLGFARSASAKVIDNLISDNRELTVEELIKQSLKKL